VNFTDRIPDIQTLRKLLFFRANLIQDGYSTDFVNDFRDYYLHNAFFNAPDYFTIGARNGKLSDYFDGTDKLAFSNRFDASTSLPSGGTYEIMLEITLDNDLQLFADNQPSAKINPTFYLTEEAKPGSAFYSFPVDGTVGRLTENGRQGYGIDFRNAGEPIVFGTFQGDVFDSAQIAGSNALFTIGTEWNKDPQRLNSLASTRGALFLLENGADVDMKSLVFSPNFATPVMLKVHSDRSDEAVKGFFTVLRGKTPELWGQNASFWTGAGACRDFTGVPANQTFAFLPDRKAESGDKASNWEFQYKVEWPAAEKAGDTYLKGYFFTPAETTYALQSSSANTAFSTANTGLSGTAPLGGVKGMAFNDQSGGPAVQSLTEVLDLVRNNNVCVTNNGTSTLFWWNTGELYKKGSNPLERQEKALVAGSSCIG
jgi:hypothetical protein